MAEESTWRLLLPRQLRELPADLATVVVLTALTILAVTLPGVRETPLRVILGLPFVLFLPGYALIAALFPEAGAGPEQDESGEGEADSDEATDDGFAPRNGRGIDGIERVALSFGLSIAVVPLLGLVLNFTPWGIRLGPILVAVGGLTFVATAVAAHRRWDLPAEERFRVPYRAWLAAGRAELFEPQSRMDSALNVLLVVSMVLAVGSVGYAVAVPKQGESFTEFYLLTETEDGDLVADDYPTEFVVGDSKPLVVGIGNQEHQRMNYTVVVELQRIEFETSQRTVPPGENATTASRNVTSVTVTEAAELGRLRTTLGHNSTYQEAYEVRPTLTGDEMRLAFLLYRETPPQEPTVENAYRETHLWVNVSQRGATG